MRYATATLKNARIVPGTDDFSLIWFSTR